MDVNVLIAEINALGESLSKEPGDKRQLCSVYFRKASKVLEQVANKPEYNEVITGLWFLAAHLERHLAYVKPAHALSELCRKLFRQCAKTILNIQWQNLKDDNSLRQSFLASLTNLHAKLVPLNFSRFQLLEDLSTNPWTHPILTKVMGGEVDDSNNEEAQSYIGKQDPVILQLRVDMMLKENCEEYALNLCNSCLGHPELQTDLTVKKTQLFLLCKLGQEDKLQEECQKLNIKDAVKVIKQLQSSKTHKKICTVLAQTFMVQNWIRPSDTEASKELLRLWIKHQLLVDKEHDQFTESVWAMAKLSQSTEQIILFIDVLREACGETFLQLYVDMCIFAINVDKGQMEASKKEGDIQAATARRSDMASICAKLSCLCHHTSIKVARICALTAFALTPTEQSFAKIGAFYDQGSGCCDKCAQDKKQIPGTVNPATLYEVERLLGMLRPDYLSPSQTYINIQILCRRYLQESLTSVEKLKKQQCDSQVSTETSDLAIVQGDELGKGILPYSSSTLFECLCPEDVQSIQMLLSKMRLQNVTITKPSAEGPALDQLILPSAISKPRILQLDHPSASALVRQADEVQLKSVAPKVESMHPHGVPIEHAQQHDLIIPGKDLPQEKAAEALQCMQLNPQILQQNTELVPDQQQSDHKYQVTQMIQAALRQDSTTLQRLTQAARPEVLQAVLNIIKGTVLKPQVPPVNEQLQKLNPLQLKPTLSLSRPQQQPLPTVATLLKPTVQLSLQQKSQTQQNQHVRQHSFPGYHLATQQQKLQQQSNQQQLIEQQHLETQQKLQPNQQQNSLPGQLLETQQKFQQPNQQQNSLPGQLLETQQKLQLLNQLIKQRSLPGQLLETQQKLQPNQQQNFLPRQLLETQQKLQQPNQQQNFLPGQLLETQQKLQQPNQLQNFLPGQLLETQQKLQPNQNQQQNSLPGQLLETQQKLQQPNQQQNSLPGQLLETQQKLQLLNQLIKQRSLPGQLLETQQKLHHQPNQLHEIKQLSLPGQHLETQQKLQQPNQQIKQLSLPGQHLEIQQKLQQQPNQLQMKQQPQGVHQHAPRPIIISTSKPPVQIQITNQNIRNDTIPNLAAIVSGNHSTSISTVLIGATSSLSNTNHKSLGLNSASPVSVEEKMKADSFLLAKSRVEDIRHFLQMQMSNLQQKQIAEPHQMSGSVVTFNSDPTNTALGETRFILAAQPQASFELPQQAALVQPQTQESSRQIIFQYLLQRQKAQTAQEFPSQADEKLLKQGPQPSTTSGSRIYSDLNIHNLQQQQNCVLSFNSHQNAIVTSSPALTSSNVLSASVVGYNQLPKPSASLQMPTSQVRCSFAPSHPATTLYSTSQPAASHPGTKLYSTSQPAPSHPATTLYSTSQPAPSHPATTLYSTSQPAPSHPATTLYSTSQPDPSRPATALYSTSHPATALYSTSQPAPSRPATALYSTSHPATALYSTSQPATSRPATALYSTSQPAPSRPATTLYSTSQLAPSHPATALYSTSQASQGHSVTTIKQPQKIIGISNLPGSFVQSPIISISKCSALYVTTCTLNSINTIPHSYLNSTLQNSSAEKPSNSDSQTLNSQQVETNKQMLVCVRPNENSVCVQPKENSVCVQPNENLSVVLNKDIGHDGKSNSNNLFEGIKTESIPGETLRDSSNDAIYRCILCGIAFKSLNHLRKHVKMVCKPVQQSSSMYNTKLRIDKASSSKAGVETTTVFQCLRCYELCVSNAGIKQHRLVCKKVPSLPSTSGNDGVSSGVTAAPDIIAGCESVHAESKDKLFEQSVNYEQLGNFEIQLACGQPIEISHKQTANGEPHDSCNNQELTVEPTGSCNLEELNADPTKSKMVGNVEPTGSCNLEELNADPTKSKMVGNVEPTGSCNLEELNADPTKCCMLGNIELVDICSNMPSNVELKINYLFEQMGNSEPVNNLGKHSVSDEPINSNGKHAMTELKKSCDDEMVSQEPVHSSVEQSGINEPMGGIGKLSLSGELSSCDLHSVNGELTYSCGKQPGEDEEIYSCDKQPRGGEQTYSYGKQPENGEQVNNRDEQLETGEKTDSSDKQLVNGEQTDGQKKQTDGQDKQTDGQDKQTDGQDKQTDGQDKQIDGQDKQTDSQDKQINGQDKQIDGQDKQTDGQDKQTDGQDKQTDGQDKQIDGQDKQTDGCDVQPGNGDKMDGLRTRSSNSELKNNSQTIPELPFPSQLPPLNKTATSGIPPSTRISPRTSLKSQPISTAVGRSGAAASACCHKLMIHATDTEERPPTSVTVIDHTDTHKIVIEDEPKTQRLVRKTRTPAENLRISKREGQLPLPRELASNMKSSTKVAAARKHTNSALTSSHVRHKNRQSTHSNYSTKDRLRISKRKRQLPLRIELAKRSDSNTTMTATINNRRPAMKSSENRIKIQELVHETKSTMDRLRKSQRKRRLSHRYASDNDDLSKSVPFDLKSREATVHVRSPVIRGSYVETKGLERKSISQEGDSSFELSLNQLEQDIDLEHKDVRIQEDVSIVSEIGSSYNGIKDSRRSRRRKCIEKELHSTNSKKIKMQSPSRSSDSTHVSDVLDLQLSHCKDGNIIRACKTSRITSFRRNLEENPKEHTPSGTLTVSSLTKQQKDRLQSCEVVLEMLRSENVEKAHSSKTLSSEGLRSHGAKDKAHLRSSAPQGGSLSQDSASSTSCEAKKTFHDSYLSYLGQYPALEV